ncbi:MAG: glycosyltransferase, exosortase A system-associated [Gammaproteobacteria bacterium]|nr:glycosyltransferase, exosortase A system-associated [Gammaproteobacteria bacterium]MDH5691590.1 glycosyltransferase, exosortase A system-associated [Gammaproteobacteria bacterium]
MKILHVLDHSIPLHSGYTFRSRAILENQRKLGWETFHLTSPKHILATKKDMLEETVDGLHFYRTIPDRGLFSKLPVLNQLTIAGAVEKRLAEVVDQVKPDVIHAHSPALNGLAAVNVGSKKGIPVVYEIRAFWEDAAVDHGTTAEGSARYRLTRALETHVVRKANAITTICEGLRQDIIARGIPDSKVTVIQNSVDPHKFEYGQKANETLRSELGLDGKKVIGFIGSFYAYEGIPLIVEAMPELIKEFPDLRFLLVGGGPQEQTIRSKIEELELNDHVLLTGRVPHEQVQNYYNLVDIFVYPRLAMRLTDLVTPLKPLEAMAQGRLVIASDVGGHRELIEPGSTGELFEAGNVPALAEAVSKLLKSESIWEERKLRARKYVEEQRNWETTVPKYRQIYERLTR